MTTDKCKKDPEYKGFEQGPIRPPSEAASLLLRITRNCPWNKCTFCPVYKGEKKFSLRPVNNVLRDIDAVCRQVEVIRHFGEESGRITRSEFEGLAAGLSGDEQMALYAAANWVAGGMKSVFLQDGDSLVVKPDEMVEILQHIRNSFPDVERVTSYARSRTIDRITEADLARIREAGLNRIHIGMESGSDKVLALVRKGVDKATHIRAGQKVKRAGMELSEYVMPGLGGRELSRDHALETADALNRIDPDFIRLRTLAIPKRTELFDQWKAGTFEKLADREVAREILLFLENLNGITSTLKSDHILNLFQEIEGTFPQDKARMTGVIRRFFALSPQEQVLYMVGRRNGLFARLDDLADPNGRRKAQNLCERFDITPENVDTAITELLERFV